VFGSLLRDKQTTTKIKGFLGLETTKSNDYINNIESANSGLSILTCLTKGDKND
jgi:hypothetical protein